MDFGVLPPEVNSARIYAGPGAGPMLAAAAGWDGLAADLHSTAASYGSVVSGLTGGPWQGPASVSMGAAAAPYVTWMSATAAQCEQVANQARAAVSAYETAFVMTVPPPVIAANRAQLAALVATNFLGQNTSAIMANEAHYGEMWAQDALAMYGYAASSAPASTLTPFTPAPATTNPGGPAGQAAAVAHTAAAAAGTHAHTMTSSLSTLPQTLQGLAQPLQSTSPISGMPQMAMGTGTSAATSVVSAPASALTGLSGASGKGVSKSAGAFGSAATALTGVSGSQLGLVEDTAGLGMDGVGLVGLDGGGVGLDLIGVGLDFLGADELTEAGGLGALGAGLGGGLGALGGLGGLGGVGAASAAGATATMGQAASLSALSVPAGWSVAAPTAIRQIAMMSAESSAAAAPVVAAGESEIPYAGMALASMAGRAMAGTAGRSRREPPQKSLRGSATAIAAELRELADLRDSGILTEEEFTEQKRRLLGG